MRYAIHDSKTVVDICLVDPADMLPRDVKRNAIDVVTGEPIVETITIPGWSPREGLTAVASDIAQIGWPLHKDSPTRPDVPLYDLDQRRAAARAECSRRILVVASPSTQANMTALVAMIGSGPVTKRSEADSQIVEAFVSGVQWIALMRAAWVQIADQSLNPAEDANWPVVPPAALALAARM